MIGPNSPKLRTEKTYRKHPVTMGRHIITFDPGGTTGWSRISLPGNAFSKADNGRYILTFPEILGMSEWQHGQIDCDDVNKGAKVMRRLVDEFPTAAVVIESFFLRQMAVDLVPVKLIAILEHHLWMKKRVLHQQQASIGKRINDDRLKELGAYTSQGGLQHARDADRHLVMAIRRCLDTKGVEFQKRLWPNEI